MLRELLATYLIILILANCLPQRLAANQGSCSPSGPFSSTEIDSEWLEEQVRMVLERNRVTEVRSWNGKKQVCTFHAPSLSPPVDYPPQLPSGLRWLWQLWWDIRLPWQAVYPHQWFWDSCAHAIVLSSLDVELAEKEIESLLYAQREDGFIPHMIWNKERMHWVDRLVQLAYPSRHFSPYIQPPAIASAVECIYKRSGDIEFVTRTLPQLKNYYLYLDRERNRSGDGLVEIIISYESGKDRSPEYDLIYGESNAKPIWRGPMLKLMLRQRIMGWEMDRIFQSNRFRVKDALFNSVYAQNLSALSRLCEVVGDEEAKFFHNRALGVEEAILSKMYDEETGLFYSLDARLEQDEQIKVNTISSLMPLILDNISQPQVERLVSEHLLNPEEYWLRYPLPAAPLNSYDADVEDHIIWRGLQTWIYPNWYLVLGLRKQAQRFPEHFQEYNRIADEITLRTYDLVQSEGLCDFYHSQSGKGAAPQFSWSSLVLDMVHGACSTPGVSTDQ